MSTSEKLKVPDCLKCGGVVHTVRWFDKHEKVEKTGYVKDQNFKNFIKTEYQIEGQYTVIKEHLRTTCVNCSAKYTIPVLTPNEALQ